MSFSEKRSKLRTSCLSLEGLYTSLSQFTIILLNGLGKELVTHFRFLSTSPQIFSPIYVKHHLCHFLRFHNQYATTAYSWQSKHSDSKPTSLVSHIKALKEYTVLITHVILENWEFVCLCAQLLQLCSPHCDPMDCSLPGSSVLGISRQEH